MLKKFLAAAVVCSIAASAYATISTALIPVFGNNPVTNVPNPISGVAADLIPQGININDGTYYSFDLVVSPDAGDDWTQTTIGNPGDPVRGASIVGGTFFQHPSNADVSTLPNAALLGFIPSLAYDTYVQRTGGAASTAGTVGNGANLINIVWFGTPPNGGAGANQRVARFTVRVLAGSISGDTVLRVRGAHTTRAGAGTLFPFDVAAAIPEPSTLALWRLGGVFGLIRRR